MPVQGSEALAILRGWAMTNDAYTPPRPTPKQGSGLSMRLAMEMAGTGIDEIGYVNAHGTGTPLNDIAETRCYELVFRGRSTPIPVSSTKSYIGHCLGAAGALEAAITILAMRRSALLPTLRLADPIRKPGHRVSARAWRSQDIPRPCRFSRLRRQQCGPCLWER